MDMRKRLLITIAAALPLLAIAGYASADGGQSSLSTLRNAIAAYHDIEVAVDAGYTVELPQTAAYGGGTCIANGADGAMGIHMVSPERIDGVLDEADPEALLYERRKDGTLKLTGVEYIVAGGPRPELFGQEFSLTNLGRYGSPDANVWTLHAWVFKPNPSGILSPWNPNVSCD
jgi:hypothetical protein